MVALLIGSVPIAAYGAVRRDNDLGLRSVSAFTNIVAVVPHRNQAQLDELLRNIARGHAKPISHAEFVRRFAPDPGSIERVTTFLRANRFTILRSGEDMVFAGASAEIVERTFGTVIHRIRSGASRVDAYQAIAPARFPNAIVGDLKTVVVGNESLHWIR